MRRRVASAAALALGCSVLLAGCQTGGEFHPAAPFAPSLRPAFGARVTGDELQIWTGSPCVGVTRLAITFDLARSDQAETVLTAGNGGATVERFTVGSVPAGMTVKQALPAGYDWSSASAAQLSLSGPPTTWGSSVQLAQVKSGSPSHPDDTFYFQDVGWLDAAQVAQQDGKTFLATCTPDPAKG